MTTNPADHDEWTGEQWKGEGQGGPPADLAREEDDSAEHWDKEQWEGEGQDDTPENHDSPMEEGENEFSGHGKNPGGGKRWGNVDRGDKEE